MVTCNTYKKTHHFKVNCTERRQKNQTNKEKNYTPPKKPPHQTDDFQLGYAIRNTMWKKH